MKKIYVLYWIPAFAGMTKMVKEGMTKTVKEGMTKKTGDDILD